MGITQPPNHSSSGCDAWEIVTPPGYNVFAKIYWSQDWSMFQTAIDGTIQAIVLDKEVGHFNKPPHVAFYTVLQSSQADTRVILYIVYHTADNLPNKTISNQLCSCGSPVNPIMRAISPSMMSYRKREHRNQLFTTTWWMHSRREQLIDCVKSFWKNAFNLIGCQYSSSCFHMCGER